MVSKKDLKEYDFSSINTYFQYIVESHMNGQFTQVKELYNNMSKKQQSSFRMHCFGCANYVNDCYGNVFQFVNKLSNK